MADEVKTTPADTAVSVNRFVQQFKASEQSKRVLVPDAEGRDVPFVIRRFSGLKEFGEMGKRIQNRLDLLKSTKGKGFPTRIPQSLIEGLESYFPECSPGNDSKGEIITSSEAEIVTATHLEAILIEPKMTWGEALVFVRVAGATAAAVLAAFNEFNTVTAKDDAKND